jgi:hypothetical protein
MLLRDGRRDVTADYRRAAAYRPLTRRRNYSALYALEIVT